MSTPAFAEQASTSAEPLALTQRATLLAVVVITAAGWLLRAWPRLAQGDWWSVPVDFDDGVYFAASALFSDGLLPYRDFVFVHPPGIVLFLLPASALAGTIPASAAFSLARWLATAVGAANIALSARLGYRSAGAIGAIAAAMLYAAFPEIASYERNPYLEPVLNLACLATANLWLSSRVERQPRWAVAAGLCLAFAFSVKLWAAVWAVACLASAPGRRAVGWLAVGGALGMAVFVLPFAAAAPEAFLEQTVAFHLWRPPDGASLLAERIISIVRLTAVIAALAAVGLIWQLAVRTPSPAWRSARFFGTAWVLLLVAFLASRTYWFEYNAHLAPAEAHLAALGLAVLSRKASGLGRAGQALVAVMLVVAPIHSLRHCVRQARNRDLVMPRFGEEVRRRAPVASCLFAFEPTWALVSGRLPPVRPGVPAVVDVYGAMLIESMRAGGRFADAQSALHAEPAQRRIRELLDGCEHIALGTRGEWQLDDATKAWLAERWERVLAPEGPNGLDLWIWRASDLGPAP